MPRKTKNRTKPARKITTTAPPTSIKPYKIEKGIKIPAQIHNPGDGQPSRANATMMLLEKGDSFRIADPIEAMKATKSVRDLNRRQRKTATPLVFATRMDGTHGLRIWRTE